MKYVRVVDDNTTTELPRGWATHASQRNQATLYVPLHCLRTGSTCCRWQQHNRIATSGLTSQVDGTPINQPSIGGSVHNHSNQPPPPPPPWFWMFLFSRRSRYKRSHQHSLRRGRSGYLPLRCASKQQVSPRMDRNLHSYCMSLDQRYTIFLPPYHLQLKTTVTYKFASVIISHLKPTAIYKWFLFKQCVNEGNKKLTHM